LIDPMASSRRHEEHGVHEDTPCTNAFVIFVIFVPSVPS
jgi:hypothetical protein